MIRCLSCCVAVCLTLVLPAQNTSFSPKSLFGSIRARHIGPAVMSGRVSTLDVVNEQPEIIYVGAAGGGVWKSISGGVGFRPVFDDHPQSIGKIAIDQNDPETVWVGTGEPWVRNSVSVGNGVYKTTNGGTSWQHLGLEDSERISDIIIHPEQSDTVYVGVQGHLWDGNEERGVFRTTDGGRTWEKILYIDENTGCADLDIDPANPNILYAAMWDHRRQPWTFDSGFGGQSGLYKSTDGGATWKVIHQGFPEGKLGRIAIATAPSNEDIVYASVECEDKERKGLYLSEDKGESWRLVSQNFNTTVRPFYFSNLVVDPLNDSIVAKCGLSMIISEDRGDRFRPMDNSVHSDVHDIWIDPNNTKHLIIGTDGGVYESHDRGYTFRMWRNLPLAQYYRISVDNAEPYNVYGGLQDNGSWYGPSQKPGGITNADWELTFGGDGFYAFPHPENEDIVFCEFQGGKIVRYNKKTNKVKWIRPYPEENEGQYRFNWNAPIHISPNRPERIYFGAQYLFLSEDMGESWTRISPDLTTNDSEKQKQHLSGGLSIDNSTAENHCTIYYIAESYLNENTIWAGTDDGNLQVSTDLGKTWTNVVQNIPDLPEHTWVSFIEPSHHDAGTAYVVFDGHRAGDKSTYVYKTTDLGKTWVNLATTDIENYALSIREDPVKANLLFLGTEFGLYGSIDGGQSWARFENNIPKVGIRDMVIHPRDHSLVLGTHGRGVMIIDDLSPLRAFSVDMAGEKLRFFAKPEIELRNPQDLLSGGGWFGGTAEFVGANPSGAARIYYYMKKRHTFGKMFAEVYKDGELIRTIPVGKGAGINVVEVPTQMDRPKAPPTNNRMALIGSLFGPSFETGEYHIQLIKGRDTFHTQFDLVFDKDSPFVPEDRNTQRVAALELYDMIEQMAYIYQVLDEIEGGATAIETDKEELEEMLTELAEKANQKRTTLIAQGGDFYVDEEEKLYERISELYMGVSSYPGKPSESQIKQQKILGSKVEDVEKGVEVFIEEDLGPVNKALEAAGLEKITFSSFSDFKANKLKRTSRKGKP